MRVNAFSKLAVVFCMVALSLALFACTASENKLDMGSFTISYPSELAPKDSSPKGTTLRRESEANNFLIYLQEANLFNNDRSLAIKVKEYSGVTFDEALAYAKTQVYPTTPSQLSEDAISKWSLNPNNYGSSACEEPEMITINGKRAFKQKWWGEGYNNTIAKSLTECVEIDEDTIAVVYCLLPDDLLQANRELLDDVFNSVEAAPRR